MKKCLDCGAQYSDDAYFCAADGTPLVDDPQEDRLIGKVIDGRYRVISQIGGGGFGAVYHSRHLRLPRDVALKVLWEVGSGDSVQLKRFEHEVQAIVAINHPNIVRVFDCGRDATVGAWVAMERLEGLDLGARLKQGPRLSVFEIQGIVKGVCRALAAAHREGIVHRDVKPSNIFLAKDSDALLGFSVRLLDFGIATDCLPGGAASLYGDAGLEIANQQVLGTPATMSPEQIDGEKVDRRSDIYGLGVTLFNMITRRSLFSGSSAQEVLIKHLMDSPRAPSLEPEGRWIPPALDNLVLQMLSKDPSARPPDAGAVQRAMEAMKSTLDAAWARIHLGEPLSTTASVSPPRTGARQPRLDTLPDLGAVGAARRLLVVDDEPAMIELLALILQRDGFEMVSALGGRAALAILQVDQVFDAIVVDMMMPDIDGLQCIAEARRLGFDRPVVMCTTLSEADVAVRIEGMADVHYLDKTRSLHRLPELLQQLGLRKSKTL